MRDGAAALREAEIRTARGLARVHRTRTFLLSGCSSAVDYGVGAVSQEQSETGWITSIEIERLGDNWMPVTVRVGHEDRRLTSQDAVQIVELRSSHRPDSVTLDPDVLLIDSDRSNNTTIIPQSN